VSGAGHEDAAAPGPEVAVLRAAVLELALAQTQGLNALAELASFVRKPRAPIEQLAHEKPLPSPQHALENAVEAEEKSLAIIRKLLPGDVGR
jgi:hypothetical protein